MAEEFKESEFSFSDRRQCRYLRRDGVVAAHRTARGGGQQSEKEMAETATATASSLPVGIPGSARRRAADREDDEIDGEEMVPPHVMAERRVAAGKMAFSVCTGNGRTLKGRDLSRVRNSILRMTGFLET